MTRSSSLDTSLGHPNQSRQLSTELPALDAETPTAFYGATQFVNQIAADGRWTPGVFVAEPVGLAYEWRVFIVGDIEWIVTSINKLYR